MCTIAIHCLFFLFLLNKTLFEHLNKQSNKILLTNVDNKIDEFLIIYRYSGDDQKKRYDQQLELNFQQEARFVGFHNILKLLSKFNYSTQNKRCSMSIIIRAWGKV